jgi:sugar/nucleoside kinase (ribokinase family)
MLAHGGPSCAAAARPPLPAQVLAKLPHLAGVLITAGGEGAAYCFAAGKAQHSGRVPVFDVQVADTTGAGGPPQPCGAPRTAALAPPPACAGPCS